MPDLVDRLRVALADRYLIERELGRGGMAIVYLAEDRKHQRRVALKVLRPELAASIGAERFLREITTAARLTHPNILPLHDSGEADGTLYYTMPYVEGDSLRDRLNREKQLPIEDALQIGKEVADALGYAHEQGIIHRDIKPENILFQRGHALVADFGIARAVTAAGAETLTETGLAVGTPAYMSPEQGTGAAELDGRSDLYSLGCVLYEMLSGETPYLGNTPQSILAKKLTEPLPRITTVRETVPAPVEAAVVKVLAKAPADRFVTAEQFVEALSADRISAVRVSGTGWRKPSASILVSLAVVAVATILVLVARPFGTVQSALPRLVVLPFENLGIQDDEYFSDGITDAINARLAGLTGLYVKSRQSAYRYKGSRRSIAEIGDELGVGYILAGTVLRERPGDPGSRVRVIPRLVRVSDDTELWAATYDDDVGEVFAVQSNIAEAVAKALEVTLLERERQSLQTVSTSNMEAYDYYLRGIEYLHRGRSKRDWEQAVRMQTRAVELDPDFALAHVELSFAHGRIWWFYHDRSQQRLVASRREAERALELDDALPQAHAALGFYYYLNRDWDHALREYETAKEYGPNNLEYQIDAGWAYRRQGRWDETLSSLRLAERKDRMYDETVFTIGETLCLLRRYADAERYLDRTIFLSPSHNWAYVQKALLQLAWRGDRSRASRVLADAFAELHSEEVFDPWSFGMWPVLVRSLADFDPGMLGELSVTSFSGDSASYYLFRGIYHGMLKAEVSERAYYDSARTVLESRLRSYPDDDLFHNQLAVAYLGLGRGEDATREALRAAEILPVSKDAFFGPVHLQTLAQVYITTGNVDAAFDQLDRLLAAPGYISVALLRVDPLYEPLRDRAGFKALVEQYDD